MKAEAYLNFIDKIKEQKPFDWDHFINSHSTKQKLYIHSPARTTMAWGGKRSGKTLGSTSLMMLMDSKYTQTDARIEIASATVEKARLLYWRNLEKANKNLGLKWEFRSGANMIITQHRDIVFRSLRDIGNADKAVGFSCLGVFVEEPHTIKERVLKHYLNNVIRINLLNIEGGRINLTTNPPPFPMPWLRKQFYKNPAVRKVHFRPEDNPWMTKKVLKKFLEEEAKELGYSSVQEALEKSNSIKRNILGEWVEDLGLVIFDQNRIQLFNALPDDYKGFNAVIGVDVGGGKARDAIVVIIYNNYENLAWVAEEMEINTAQEDIEKLATNIKYFYEKYRPLAITLDYGGIGSRLAQILTQRYGIPGVIPAIKKDKMAHLEEMRAEAYRGRLLFSEKSELYQEFSQIIYTEDHSGVDDENGLHSDLLDACLYAMRFVWNSWPEKKPEKKSYKFKRIRELLAGRQARSNRIGY